MKRSTGQETQRSSKAGSSREANLPPGAPRTFPVVGIGASAGGLEALEQFFAQVPEKIGMAFIVVPHLDPSHASLMTELMRRVTKLDVSEAQDDTAVKPDHIYIIPPNRDMTIERMTLRLQAPKKVHGIRMPIDSFFRSLADDQADSAIGIILSGTGTDGTLGVRAIHGAGGMIIAQSPDSAKYGGMPTSAIQTGFVDYTLPPEKMPEQLRIYVTHLGRNIQLPPPREDRLKKILAFIRSQTGQDFSLYKKSTLYRRVEKRMSLLDVSDITEYLDYLQVHRDETSLLAKDLLIGVTQFFRDPDAFDSLKASLVSYLSQLPGDSMVRVWVPACGTGEEAYSIAILIAECLDELKLDMKVQVFGTDVDAESIARARVGSYADNIAADITPGRLRRYFVREEGGFRVRKEIRETIIYAVHDAAKDPPFTKLDLLSCRNLLIYFEAELQDRILPLFHYALKPGGLMFLGPSESIGKSGDLFETLDKKWKIFQAKKLLPSVAEDHWEALPWVHSRAVTPPPGEAANPKDKDIIPQVQKALLDSFAPPSVVADEKGEILYIHGQTGKYLEPAQGRPSWNVHEMAREGLRLEIRSGIPYALSRGKDRSFENLRVRTDGSTHLVNVRIQPFKLNKEAAGLVIITFEDAPVKAAAPRRGDKGRPASGERDKRLAVAERELAYTRESLQSTVEELQAANEELKSTNEEMQSTNEELQSTNEELETSREELQSMNEELVTVNSELQSKIDQLSQTETDMKVLLDNTNIGIVFLDNHLMIKRFTSEVAKILQLIPGDIGRPIHDIRTNLDYDSLEADARGVLESLERREREVQAKGGEWYLMRIMPYRTAEAKIGGAVLTFTNISGMKAASEEALRRQAKGEVK